MRPGQIIIDEKIANRIEKSIRCENEKKIGYLVGSQINDDVHIVGAITCSEPAKLASELQKVELYLPGGLSIAGIYLKTTQASYKAIVEQLCKIIFPTQFTEMSGATTILVYAAEINPSENSHVYWYNLKTNTAESVESTRSREAGKSNVMFRLRASIPFAYRTDENLEKQNLNIFTEMFKLRSQLLGPNTFYQIEQSSVVATGKGKPVEGATLPYDQRVATMRDLLTTAGIFEKFGLKKNSNDLSKVVVNVRLLHDITSEAEVTCAPVIHHKHENYTSASMMLQFDAVCLASDREAAVNWATLIQEALSRQITAVTSYLTSNQGGKRFPPRPIHFWPAPLQHLFTLIYPDGIDEKKMEEFRRTIQQSFLLPTSRPYTKAVNAYHFADEVNADIRLINVHSNMQFSSANAHMEHLVDGSYSYYHYMQDHVNDDGWGCAYRSLQTLVSWFKLQGYTEKAVPTHTEIQQILVDIDDKPPKFVGSKQWIGSVEVSYVLNTLLEVDSKTLYVSSGAELGSKGRELAQHFDTQGTPVMIGGGVYAHTILGVRFNETTGDIKFLILDPHYKGSEDIRTILEKGWCGWKGADFWDQIAYYNICMPQRPDMI